MGYLPDHDGARRRTRTLIALALAAGGAAAAAWAVRDIPLALGARPTGARAERMRRSPQYRHGAFRNSQAPRPMPPGSGWEMLWGLVTGYQQRRPSGAVPLVTPDLARWPSGPALSIIWFGHASTLVEIEGHRVLFDPVWSLRCSPSARVGPRRMHPPPVPLEQLGPLDAIVISHDHYDHLDLASVRTLVRTQSAPFVVPLGVGAHLDRWGVPAPRVIELDWGEGVPVAGLRLTATAARHFSGRTFARDGTLWGSWVLAGRTRRVFYTGDTGYFTGLADIAAGYGPFDATLMQVGAYAAGWPNVHMTPEEAVTAHLDLCGGLLIPVHWATFNLAFHAWSEPVDRIWREAKARGVTLAIPRPGERVDVDDPPPVAPWWQPLSRP
jgi:L-ascorbate metabolism protein UlaG (beta-lactamase superfamily)